MAQEKTTAIVLRVIEYSETSCIVTMMTRTHGKITAMAKGARRPKSPFEAALDVLSVCRIVFIQKRSGAMDLLTEAKLDRRFRAGSSCLERLYAGYYVAELLNLLTDDADPHPELFDVAIQTIKKIDSGETKTDSLDETILDFELMALSCLGHLPLLTQCVGCGKEKTTLSRVSFGMNSGGILCQSCRRGKRNVISLSPSGFAFLLDRTDQKQQREYEVSNHVGVDSVQEEQTTIYNNQFQTPDRLTRGQSGSEAMLVEDPVPEVRSLLRSYISHLIGYQPRLQKFLNNTGRRTAKSKI